MINLEIDGKPVAVDPGKTVMDAAHKLGIYVPHFCYHEKLSIAANCRMCLVQVEKAPKPLPACATPVTEGMKVFTQSPVAKTAQKGVMEFLLINHPLDCPICDQGGECQLQDLSVGYGGSGSRYAEDKRVVVNKDLGPLISTDMTRCIHCTRCVRFGQEIAGDMELGMLNRGEHAEITQFLGTTVDSELSGNMIDLCPVGALTSKPFRFSARTWEMVRRASVSPHCGLGSNLTVQVKNNKVMRVLPSENEAVNECWLSDKDRFAYEGLNAPERLQRPMVCEAGVWREVDWQFALNFVAERLKRVATQHGAAHIGALATPHQSPEELYLLQKLLRGLGSNNVDFRLRQADFRADESALLPWLGMPIADISKLESVLIVGSNVRKDHPLIAHRLRDAARRGARIHVLHSAAHALAMKNTSVSISSPDRLILSLEDILNVVYQQKAITPTLVLSGAAGGEAPSAWARSVAESLLSKPGSAVFLGNFAQHHPQAARLHVVAQEIARLTDSKFGFFGEAANSVGGFIAGAVPHSVGGFIAGAVPHSVGGFIAGAVPNTAVGDFIASAVPNSSVGGFVTGAVTNNAAGATSNTSNEAAGFNAARMLNEPRKAYVLLGVEPELDCHDAAAAMSAMQQAELVVALSAYRHHAERYAHVMLPIAPFSETAGTFVNTEGRVQTFDPVVLPLGEARPAWKVLRVLGNLLGLPGFEFDTVNAVRSEIAPDLPARVSAMLNNSLDARLAPAAPQALNGALQRVSEVGAYEADAIVRRASALHATHDGRAPSLAINRALFEQLKLRSGGAVTVRQGARAATLPVTIDDSVPPGCVRIAAARAETAPLGAMFGTVQLEAV